MDFPKAVMDLKKTRIHWLYRKWWLARRDPHLSDQYFQHIHGALLLWVVFFL